MLKRWAAWPALIRWLAGIAAVVLAAAIVWALFVPLADWLARHDVGPAKPALLQTARDAARGRLLTLVAGLFAAGALVFTALNFTLSRRTFELTEQGQVTDRFTKAIEQLGSDKLDVRIGGIYALERIARDSAEDHPTVMEVLTAFIREHSREPWPPSDAGQPVQERSTRPDIQAAATAVGRRDPQRDILVINLATANLTRANLAGAILPRANLATANLTGARLTGARLTGADLAFADLAFADLAEADISGAHLADAHLAHARLTGANLARARLTEADLTGADLLGADLTGADLAGADLRAILFRANLTKARLIGVRLTDTVLGGADLTGADLTGADLTGARLTDTNLTDTNLTRADLTRADLTRADLTRADLASARLTGADLTGVRWPEGAQVPEGWMADAASGRLKRAGELSEVLITRPSGHVKITATLTPLAAGRHWFLGTRPYCPGRGAE